MAVAEAISDVREGRGRLIILAGDSGVGKTRLLAHLRRLPQAADLPDAGSRDREYETAVCDPNGPARARAALTDGRLYGATVKGRWCGCTLLAADDPIAMQSLDESIKRPTWLRRREGARSRRRSGRRERTRLRLAAGRVDGPRRCVLDGSADRLDERRASVGTALKPHYWRRFVRATATGETCRGPSRRSVRIRTAIRASWRAEEPCTIASADTSADRRA